MRIEAGRDSAECFVFSYKEGLLSTVAHDLKIRVEHFTIDITEDPPSIVARFDTRSLRVVNAMRDGAEAPGAISASDKGQIERHIARDVLRPARNPEARFTAMRVTPTPGAWDVQGALVLNGRERPITVPVRREGDRLTAEVGLFQPDFGIKPYSAMLGTLRVQPTVLIRTSVVLAELPVIAPL